MPAGARSPATIARVGAHASAAGRAWGAARLLAPLRAPRAFRRLTLAALVALWVIVPSGTTVRLTGSGLGCPDVPFCDGTRVVPAADGHAWIEFSNRLLSAAVMIVAVLTYLVARGLAGRPAPLRRWSLAIAAATVAQIPLGAVTVWTGLHPLAVSAHFLLSMLALAAGAVLYLRARDWASGTTRRWSARQGAMAVGVAAALAATLTTGVLVTAAGPHSGDLGVVQRFGDFSDAAYVHVRAAVAFVALAAVLVAWLWRERSADRGTRRLAALALPLAIAQVAVGEYQFRHGLPWQVVAVHVSLAALLWALVVALAWRVARRPRAPDHAPRQGVSASPVEVGAVGAR